MAETSAIEWTDATVNFWWGCTKVGPGCDHCYAETWSKRTGGVWLGWDGTQAKPSHLGLDRPIGVIRIGKARAGRLLDGREWNEMPRAL